MNNTKVDTNKISSFRGLIISLALMGTVLIFDRDALAARAPVNLGAAGNFAILAKSGISTVPPSVITGDIGVSPIDSTAITGFSLIHAAGSSFATSTQVRGKVYAANYGSPTPANLTTAIGDMMTAYTDAAGRTIPDFTELGAGQIGGLTLVPGLYKWGTDVLISSDVILSGGPNDVWIFQIAGKIILANGKKTVLTGGALSKNIFWQSFGVISLGTTTHFAGIVMAKTAITVGTGASVDGRLFAQTAVTLESDTVTAPSVITSGVTLVGATSVNGPYSNATGQSVNYVTRTITVPQSGNTQFYRIKYSTALTIATVRVSGNNVLVTFD